MNQSKVLRVVYNYYQPDVIETFHYIAESANIPVFNTPTYKLGDGSRY